MEIKPCPFCGSEKVSLGSCLEKLQQVECINCGANGPCVDSANKAVFLWNFAQRKEDVEMKKNCANCVHISKKGDGKVYCIKDLAPLYSCKHYEPDTQLAQLSRHCETCKYSYFKMRKEKLLAYCKHEIGSPEGYVCSSWKAKESISTPLTPSNSSVKPFIDLARDELDVIRTLEPIVNRYLMAAEEAAELAQAMLKYCRACGHGSWTSINPKDATDAVIEKYADLLLAMEAGFPRHEGNKMFYNNLERVYREKAKRWAERLKEAKEK